MTLFLTQQIWGTRDTLPPNSSVKMRLPYILKNKIWKNRGGKCLCENWRGFRKRGLGCQRSRLVWNEITTSFSCLYFYYFFLNWRTFLLGLGHIRCMNSAFHTVMWLRQLGVFCHVSAVGNTEDSTFVGKVFQILKHITSFCHEVIPYSLKQRR